jgi:hypothetical protein
MAHLCVHAAREEGVVVAQRDIGELRRGASDQLESATLLNYNS